MRCLSLEYRQLPSQSRLGVVTSTLESSGEVRKVVRDSVVLSWEIK